jgi:hypothetical protein
VTRGYIKTEDDGSGKPLPVDVYDVEVLEVRKAGEMKDDGSFTVFMDLQVLDGPDAKSVTSVSLNFPAEENTKAQFWFKKKARGFFSVLREVDEDLEGDDEMEAIMEAMDGVKLTARLGIQAKGQYKGSQELLETRPLGESFEDPDDDDDDDDDEAAAEPEAKPETKAQRLRREAEEAEAEEAGADDEPEPEPEKKSARKPRAVAKRGTDKVGF